MPVWLQWVTGIGAAVGAVLGIFNFVKAYLERARLRINVDWEWGDQDGSFPRIVVTNLGGRTIYIGDIEFVEADGTRTVIATFDNREIKPHQNFEYRPVWQGAVDDERAEITTDDPEFRHGWEGLRIIVRDAKGKEWKSRKPTEKPSWFRITKPMQWDEIAGL